jgi:pimeloyl-ACP methyl ester carboxylesterase
MSGRPGVAIEGSREALGHPEEVVAAHARVLARSRARSRYVDVAHGQRIHVIQAGQGTPLVMLHGSGPTALLFLPLLERLTGVQAIAVDRPGFGLSDQAPRRPADDRDAAIETLTAILDSLGLHEAALLGNSMGGTWALWFALAHPDRVTRLVLLGAPPLLSATRVPPPMLGVAGPPAGPPPHRPPPSQETVVQSMSIFEEGNTIVRYPEQIEALVAAGSDESAGRVSLAELRAAITPDGWRPSLLLKIEELRSLAVPTLLIWGERDPLGGADVAQRSAAMISDARLEMLPAGHAPWLGHPERVATLVSDFLR